MSTGIVRHSRLVLFAAAVLVSSRARAITLTQGIDVSHWQGTINWTKVAADDNGIKFAFMKATDGTSYIDTTFATNITNATAAGVLTGPYHYGELSGETSSTAVADGAAEANHFLATIKTYYKSGEHLPPVADIEGTLPSKSVTSLWVSSFSDTIYASLGVRPLIYTGKSNANTHYDSTVSSVDPLWVAWWRLNGTATPPTNSDVAPWSTWKFWQWSDGADSIAQAAPVNGISGNLDRDVFNGSLTQLDALLMGKDVSEKPGDFNRDGVVDTKDYNLWSSQNGTTVPMYTGADANGDTKVNTTDYNVWLANAPAPAPVPEPDSRVLLIVVFTVMLGTMRGGRTAPRTRTELA